MAGRGDVRARPESSPEAWLPCTPKGTKGTFDDQTAHTDHLSPSGQCEQQAQAHCCLVPIPNRCPTAGTIPTDSQSLLKGQQSPELRGMATVRKEKQEGTAVAGGGGERIFFCRSVPPWDLSLPSPSPSFLRSPPYQGVAGAPATEEGCAIANRRQHFVSVLLCLRAYCVSTPLPGCSDGLALPGFQRAPYFKKAIYIPVLGVWLRKHMMNILK